MKTEIDQLANRHLRPDPQGVLPEAGQTRPGSVCVRMSAAMANSRAGQHAVWMLVNLLCRQFKVVRAIVLDVPEVPLQTGVAPFGTRPSLGETLVECVRLVSGAHIDARPWTSSAHCDVELLVGVDPMQSHQYWRLHFDGWRYFVGRNGHTPKAPPTSGLSVGPYLCASYAAGEVFKLFRGMKPGKGAFIQEHFASAWTMSDAGSWGELEDGPQPTALAGLPHFYFAGAGAVAQAAALCLGSSGFTGSCTVVDQDSLDLTNDNRYVLSHKGDEHALKVDVIRAYLESHGFTCTAIQAWWEEFNTSRGRHASSPTVRALEQRYRFPLVLSCVDKNAPRHALQNSLPQIIVAGSTHGLTAKSNLFHLGSGSACLKCHNPIRPRNEVVRERIQELSKMTGEQQAIYCAERDIRSEDVARLLGPVGCGKLSESDIDRFAADSPEMSVGFVSGAAGVLLAAQLIRLVGLGPKVVIEGGSLAVATFTRAKLRNLHWAPESACDCKDELLRRWRAHWRDA